jgi:hypothetical protein
LWIRGHRRVLGYIRGAVAVNPRDKWGRARTSPD